MTTDSDNCFYKNKVLEVVDKFKYLGVCFGPFLKFNKHVEFIENKTKVPIFNILRILNRVKNVNWNTAIKLYNSYAKSILFYAVILWGWNNIDLFVSMQCLFIRKFLALSNFSSSDMIMKETGCMLKKIIIKISMTYLFKNMNNINNTLIRDLLLDQINMKSPQSSLSYNRTSLAKIYNAHMILDYIVQNSLTNIGNIILLDVL